MCTEAYAPIIYCCLTHHSKGWWLKTTFTEFTHLQSGQGSVERAPLCPWRHLLRQPSWGWRTHFPGGTPTRLARWSWGPSLYGPLWVRKSAFAHPEQLGVSFRKSGRFFNKVKCGVNMRPRNSVPRYTPKRNEILCPQKHLYANVHSSIIHNKQKVEITQMFTNGRMD